MQCNMPILQSCKLGDAIFVVGPMSQACAWPNMIHPKKSTTWTIPIVKGSIKEDLLDTIREEIFLKAKAGDLILGTTSTRTKVAYPSDLPIKGPACMRGPPS